MIIVLALTIIVIIYNTKTLCYVILCNGTILLPLYINYLVTHYFIYHEPVKIIANDFLSIAFSKMDTGTLMPFNAYLYDSFYY